MLAFGLGGSGGLCFYGLVFVIFRPVFFGRAVGFLERGGHVRFCNAGVAVGSAGAGVGNVVEGVSIYCVA